MSMRYALPCRFCALISAAIAALLAPPPVAASLRMLDRFVPDRASLLTERAESDGLRLTDAEAPPAPILVAQATPGAAAAALPQTPVVCLLDFESETLTSGEKEALSQAAWARMRQLTGVRLLPREDTRRWLISHDLHPAMPYREAIPLQEVVSALRADYLVTGNVDQVQGLYTVDYSIYSAGSAAPIVQDARLQRASLDEMVGHFGDLAGQMRQEIVSDSRERRAVSLAIPAPDPNAAAITAPTPMGHKRASNGAGKIRVSEEPPVIEEPVPTAVAVQEMPTETPEEATVGTAGAGTSIPPASVTTPGQTESDPWHATSTEEENPKVAEAAAEVEDGTSQEAGARLELAETAPAQGGVEAEVAQPEPTGESSLNESLGGEAAASAADESAAASAGEETPEDKAKRAEQLYHEAILFKGADNAAIRLQKLREASDLDPASPVYQRALANEYYRAGELDKVIEHCERTLALMPNDSAVLTIKASALFSLKRFEEAREVNKAAIESDPENLYARYNFALTLDELDAPEEAQAWRDYLEKAKDDPTHNRLKLLDHARERLAQLEKPGS